MTDREVGRPRLVVFLGGFDPRGARHYYRLFSEHAALQAQVDGCAYDVGPRQALDVGQGQGAHRHARWSFRGPQGGGDYVFFDWSDQVRAHWPRTLGRVIVQACGTYAHMLKDWRVLRPLRKPVPYTLLAFAYPALYAVLAVVVAMVAAAAGWHWAQDRLGFAQWLVPAVVASAVLSGAAALDKWLHMSWLLRIFNFACSNGAHHSPIMAARTRSMAEWVAGQAAQQPGLEVVVLGFSVGSVLAVRLVDALREQLPAQADAASDVSNDRLATLTLLTLGNCIPLFSLRPKALALRSALEALAADRQLYWADISSPGDSVSFGMCDLLQLSLREAQLPQKVQHNPRRMCSPRFHKLFDPQTYRLLRRNKMRLHFQYLMASQKPGAYNFFAMLTVRGAVREFVEKYLVR
jgi:hypothetical protein